VVCLHEAVLDQGEDLFGLGPFGMNSRLRLFGSLAMIMTVSRECDGPLVSSIGSLTTAPNDVRWTGRDIKKSAG
jgi:hypothetical protein